MKPPEAHSPTMSELGEVGELVTYLIRSSRLSPAEARRVVSEVMAYLNETPEHFIRRRHLQLQAEGHSNAAIFQQIARELPQRRFSAPAFSERQIRRVIYG